MPRLILLGLLLVLAAAPLAAQTDPLPPGTFEVAQPQGDLTRRYLLTVPPNLDPGQPAPLVIVLHGQTGTGARTRGYTNFDALANQHGFYVAYPDGVGGSWNDGRPGADALLPDDLAFLRELVRRISAVAPVAADRVYLAGISAGGMLTYRAACVLPDVFAAVAVVAATLPDYVIADCAGTPPIPIVVFHGTDDPILPWMGIPGTFQSAAATLDHWAAHNGCTATRRFHDLPDTDPADGTRVIRITPGTCPATAPVVVYSIVFGGHTWPGQVIPALGLGALTLDIDATALIWQFFNRE